MSLMLIIIQELSTKFVNSIQNKVLNVLILSESLVTGLADYFLNETTSTAFINLMMLFCEQSVFNLF